MSMKKCKVCLGGDGIVPCPGEGVQGDSPTGSVSAQLVGHKLRGGRSGLAKISETFLTHNYDGRILSPCLPNKFRSLKGVPAVSLVGSQLSVPIPGSAKRD